MIIPHKPALERCPYPLCQITLLLFIGFYIHLTMYTWKPFQKFYSSTSNCTAIKQRGLQFLNDLSRSKLQIFVFTNPFSSKEGKQMASDNVSSHC